jgi:predicted permease
MQWPWRKADNDLDRELQYHLETLADDYQRRGMSREEAMRRARIDFGGVDQVKEECRDERWWSPLMHVAQDVRFGWRMMRKSLAVTLTAVATLALGIGATTTILSLADAVLWRPLPVPAPEQLVELLWDTKTFTNVVKSSSGSNFADGALHVADFFSQSAFQAMRARAMGKAEVAAHTYGGNVSTSFRGNVTVTRLRAVSGNFLPMLRLTPYAGRLLEDSDDRPESPSAVVVTHRFYLRHLGQNPKAVGQTLRINNHGYLISGILPEQFRGILPGDETDLYVTIHHSPDYLAADSWIRRFGDNPLTWWMQLMVRVSPDTNPGDLRAVLQDVFASTWAVKPESPEATPRLRIQDARNGLGAVRRRMGDPVSILMFLVALVLLVACANIANLLLARAVQREKEVALRVSLGCGRGRLMRQFFTESLMLAAIGGVFSLGVAAMLANVMTALLTGFDMVAPPNAWDARILAGTAAVTLLAALLFGLYPAWRATRVDVAPALKEGSGSGGTASRTRWLPAKTLIVVQVSLGVLLVTSAIVFTSHLNELANRETGFERSRMLLFDIRPGEIGHKQDQLKHFYFHIEQRLASVPGIEYVGLARTRPMRGYGYWDELRRRDQKKGVHSAIHHGNPALLGALGVQLIAGRAMTPQEARQASKVAILSEDLAKRLELANPIGARVRDESTEYEVIGVARNARYSGMREAPPVAYLPFPYDDDAATVLLRTSMPPMALVGAVRQAIKELDANLPLMDVYTMDQQISRVLERERLFAWLCGGFGVLALLLCIVGIYGLMAHSTARRTPEIGIRIALGASRRDVLRQVVCPPACWSRSTPHTLHTSTNCYRTRTSPTGRSRRPSLS